MQCQVNFDQGEQGSILLDFSIDKHSVLVDRSMGLKGIRMGYYYPAGFIEVD